MGFQQISRACWVLGTLTLALGMSLHPTGAVRAADAPAATATISFCANLSPDEESAPTYSDAVGLALFTLQRADLKLTWEVSFKNLTTSPVAASIHGPQRPGANAGVVFGLVKKGDPIQSPIKGALVLDDGQLEYLLTERLYVNITTQKYAEGELRGQLERLLPGAACPAPKPLPK